MDFVKCRGKKNFILKTLERCGSIHGVRDRSSTLWKIKSTHNKDDPRQNKRKNKSQVAPEGCFSVYVGPEKQRFAVKTEYASHPLFKALLEDAELEYGYSCEGPILIPCDVHIFYSVLAEMEMGSSQAIRPAGCGFVCSPFNPTRRLGNSDMGRGYGSYGLLTKSRSSKMNQFWLYMKS